MAPDKKALPGAIPPPEQSEPTERTPLLPPPGPPAQTQDESEESNGNDQKKTPNIGARKILGIILALTGVFLAGADQSFIMATYVEVASELRELHDASWLLTGYNLGYCVALPVYGKMGDSFGRKAPLVAAYAIFGLGCFISGIGFALWHVIVGRAITGIGAAGMVSLVSVVITDHVPSSQVALLRSYVSIVSVCGRSSGGPLGAIILDAFGWKWSFLGQIPFIALCCFSSLILMPDVGRPSKQDSMSPGAEEAKQTRSLDLLGLATFTLTILSFLTATSLASEGHTIANQNNNFQLYLSIILTLLFLTLFLLIEVFWAKNPLIPLKAMGKIVNIYLGVQIILFIARATHMANLAPYFVRIEGFSSTEIAGYITASPLGFTVGSVIGGHIIKWTHRIKLQSLLSLASSILIYILIAAQWNFNTHVLEALYTALAGLTFGLLLTATFAALATESQGVNMVASTITTYYLFQEIGSMIGTGGSVALLQSKFQDGLYRDLKLHGPEKDRVIENVLKDIEFSKTLRYDLQEQIREIFRSSFQFVAYFAAAMAGLALPVLGALPEQILE